MMLQEEKRELKIEDKREFENTILDISANKTKRMSA